MAVPMMHTAGNPLAPLQAPQVQAGFRTAGTGQAKVPAFAEVLRSKVEGIRFSAHAAQRLLSRNIALTPELVGKLEKAVSGAAVKGARDSLVLTKTCAFIVNIPNRTVITAMDGESLKENIFTNIDSAVIAD